MKRIEPFEVSDDHPAYAGHFPHFPVLPGAVLLDEALRLLRDMRSTGMSSWHISSAKFLSAVRPGDPLRIEYQSAGEHASTVRFSIYAAERTVVSGVFAAAHATPP